MLSIVLFQSRSQKLGNWNEGSPVSGGVSNWPGVGVGVGPPGVGTRPVGGPPGVGLTGVGDVG